MLSRREFLTTCLAAAGAACLGVDACASKDRCLPVIRGPLWWYDPAQSSSWGAAGWRDELDQQARIGFDLLWLCGTQGAMASEESTRAFADLLDMCAKRKVRVVVDTGSSGMWYDPLDLNREVSVCGKHIQQIAGRFKGHPALYAWYVPQEIYMTWPDEPMYGYIHNLYPALVECCKKATDLPVTVSPFFILDKDKVFGGFRYNEPDAYRDFWAHLTKKSGFDVVMLQDSGEHFSYVTNEMRRPFFQAMYDACKASGTRFWGNVETAEYVCPSKEEFVRLYGRVHHSVAKGLPWRAVPIERMREKLDLAAEFSEEIVTWGYREFCRPVLSGAAAGWYKDYKAYYRGIGAL